MLVVKKIVRKNIKKKNCNLRNNRKQGGERLGKV